MKQYKILFFFFASMLLIVSCDKDFEEINKDPNNPTTIEAHLLLPSSVRTAQNLIYNAQFGGDLGACWVQHYSKVQYHDESLYFLTRPGVIDSYWNNMYAVVISDADAMYNLAELEENNNLMAVALTLQAYGYSLLTDVFGDVPLSEAMRADEGIFLTKYDKQQDVYTGILELLTRANSLYGSGDIDETSDILYAGDAAKWQKFTNSLKFRSLMRISGKVDVSADLQSLVNAGNMFDSNDDEAKLIYLSAAPSANPLWETVVDGGRPEYKVNATIIDNMLANNDPRLPQIAQLNDAGIYRGKPAGIINVPNSEYNYNNVSAIGLLYLDPTAPGFCMSNPELLFLMAEAAQKGYISGSASTYYEAGITASFEANQVSDGGYIAANSLGGNALEQIGTQKWLALYGQGIEAWTEWRRVGYPALTPAIEGELDHVPTRVSYPTIEASVNSESYEAAVAAQGPDNLSTPLWWMN